MDFWDSILGCNIRIHRRVTILNNATKDLLLSLLDAKLKSLHAPSWTPTPSRQSRFNSMIEDEIKEVEVAIQSVKYITTSEFRELFNDDGSLIHQVEEYFDCKDSLCPEVLKTTNNNMHAIKPGSDALNLRSAYMFPGRRSCLAAYINLVEGD